MKELHLDNEINSFWSEFEDVAQEMLKCVQEKHEGLYSKTGMMKHLYEIYKSRKDQMEFAQLVYKWLLEHKPKNIRDGILNEIRIVEAKFLGKEAKSFLIEWCKFQLAISEKGINLDPELAKSVDNKPAKVFGDCQKVMTDILNLIQ